MPVTITVSGTKPPSPGKTNGIVIDTTNKWWWIKGDPADRFFAGQSYNVDYTTREWQGKTYYTISSYQPSGATVQQQPQPQQQQSAPQRQFAPSVDDNARRLDIFICGAFNNLMANPTTVATDMSMMDMIDTIHKLKGAWMAVFGPSPLPRRPDPNITSGQPSPPPQRNSDDMNDDIPF